MKKNKFSGFKIKNSNAFRNYELIEKYEAGISLAGTEVKSIVKGKANISDSYAIIKNGEAYILNMHVSPYEFGDRDNKEPNRNRKLLLHKKEILKINQKIKEKSLSLIPTYLYMKNNKIKVELWLGKGKKLYDKRYDLMKKEVDRKIERKLKNYR